MGIAKKSSMVKLFVGIMYVQEEELSDVLSQLQQQYGDIDSSYGPVQVQSFTEYYSKEMGRVIFKTYITFKKLIPREELSDIKNWTNELENRFLSQGNRRINIDPGYLAPDKLVLASTKDFFHRIYLRNGIFAEVTLHCRRGRFRYFSWTYPDFKTEAMQRYLLQQRNDLYAAFERKQDE